MTRKVQQQNKKGKLQKDTSIGKITMLKLVNALIFPVTTLQHMREKSELLKEQIKIEKMPSRLKLQTDAPDTMECTYN